MKAVVVFVLLWSFVILFGGCRTIPEVSSASSEWSPEPVHFDSTPLHHVWQGPDQRVYAGGGRTENLLLRWNGTGWETLTPIPGRIHFGFTSRDGTVWFLTRHLIQGRSQRSGNIQGLWRWTPDSEAPETVEGFDPGSFRIPVSSVHFHAAEDAEGRIFLTSHGPVIYLIEDGRFREWHSIETAETRARPQSHPNWGTLYPLTLHDGRVAVIGYGPSNYNVFSGYLVIGTTQGHR